MIKKTFFFFVLIFAVTLQAKEIPIIPKPLKAEVKSGFFEINADTRITFNQKDDDGLIGFLTDFLYRNYNLKLHETYDSDLMQQAVNFVFDDSFMHEAYNLVVDDHAVTIRGGRGGLFYGLQSLLQLMPVENTGSLKIPFIEVEDEPRFKYRGALLDVGRYFFTVDEVKRFLDLMAHYKLNVFHWHLTEDAGWRIEIKKYPRLTEIGAWRRGTQRSHDLSSFDRLPHGGFYTQEQIKDIVAYAQKRNITVIPEIDMPGHTLSLLAAYPEVSCTGGPFKVLESWGIQEDVLCAGNERTYEMVFDILDEVLELFPSEIIHVGGDEAPKNRWKECEKCQKKIKDENLENEEELQSYFIKRIGNYLYSKGRKMLGWDEIMQGGLAPGAMVMGWRGETSGLKAAEMGHEVVMVPNSHMYIDYYQGKHEEEPFNIGGFLPLRNVYDYEPYSPNIPDDYHKFIVGVQGNLWMEFIHSREKLDYMAFPRLIAIAEIGWSKQGKDFDDFESRLSENLRWLDKKRVNFRVPNPIGLHSAENKDGKFKVSLKPPVRNSKIYYTLDGKDPLLYGTLYDEPIMIDLTGKELIVLKCVVRTETGRVSGTRSAVYRKSDD